MDGSQPPSSGSIRPINMDNTRNSHTPISPVQLPTNYSVPNTGRISGTPQINNNTSGNNGNAYGEGVTAHSRQLLRNAFAQIL